LDFSVEVTDFSETCTLPFNNRSRLKPEMPPEALMEFENWLINREFHAENGEFTIDYAPILPRG
jgi:hypothetical protein